MRTEQIQVYEFKDLDKEAKEKAIEDLRCNEGYMDYEWFDYLFEEFREKLSKIGINCQTFYFDLHNNTFQIAEPFVADNNKLIKNSIGEKYLIMLDLENQTYNCNIWDSNESNFIEFWIEDDDEDDEKDYKTKRNLEEKIEKKLNTFLKNLTKTFLNKLSEDYDYFMSDEAIEEHIEANEFEYLKGGEQY